MDIKTMGLKVFRVLDYSNPVNGKSYSAGNVKYIESHDEQDPYMKSYMIEKLEEFFSCIHYIGKPSITQELISYDIIHKLGLTLEEEYKILKMEREIDRQEFITGYLDRMIPALKRAEKVGDIIKMNGHFKYLDPINF